MTFPINLVPQKLLKMICWKCIVDMEYAIFSYHLSFAEEIIF